MNRWPASVAIALIRLLICAGLLFFLARWTGTGLSEMASVLRSGNLLWLTAGLGLFFVGCVFYTGAWFWVNRAAGNRVPFGTLLQIYFLGLFVNSLFPTFLAGEAARGIALRRDPESRELVFTGLLTHRVLNLLLLAILAAGGAMLSQAPVAELLRPWLGAAAAAGVLLGAGLLYFARRSAVFARPSASPPKGAISRALRALIDTVSRMLRTLADKPRPFAAVIAFALLYRFALIGTWTCIAAAIAGPELLSLDFVLLIPLVDMVSLLAVTPHAIGVRENGFVFLFSFLGWPKAELVVIPEVFSLYVLLFALLGAFGFRRFTPRKQRTPADEPRRSEPHPCPEG